MSDAPRLTKELVASACKERIRKGDTVETFLQTVTHVSLQDKGIDDLEALKYCTRVQVLYLYQNRINSLMGISGLRQVTHLYLQHNLIRSLDCLAGLTMLKKLNVSNNCIERVDSLSRCRHIEEVLISLRPMSVAVV